MAQFSSITFTNLKSEIERYLKLEHNKAGILFSSASPYGQILTVVENLHQLSILYLKNAINQFDLGDANSNNERVIKNAAILAGHIPFRSISSSGTLKFVKKSGLSDDDLPRGIIRFNNRTTLKNQTNGLFYSLDLGKIRENISLVPGSGGIQQFFIRVVQGKWQERVFTGDGNPMQTFSIQDTDGKDIENFNFEVTVNGIIWAVKKHVYDLLPNEMSCVVRTGFNGGIDVIFGNNGFGYQPELGSRIVIKYLQTDGSSGNIYNRKVNDWKIIDDVLDSNGDTVNLDKIFDIEIYNDINFGSDKEDYRFTKSLLPFATNNFVLALPQHYAYELKKLGIFTLVNAKEENGTIIIYVVPDIRLFKRSGETYFTIPISNERKEVSGYQSPTVMTSAFELDSYERQKIVNYLRSSGVIQLTRKFIVKAPKLSFYVVEIKVIRYSDARSSSVKTQIVNLLSEYFLNLTRIDRIPKSEIIKQITNLRDVYSVDINFISKKNEDYHRSGYNQQNYNPTSIFGLSNDGLGDILFEADELPVLRGNWYDRYDNYYVDEDPSLEYVTNGPVLYIEVGEVRSEDTKSPDPKKLNKK